MYAAALTRSARGIADSQILILRWIKAAKESSQYKPKAVVCFDGEYLLNVDRNERLIITLEDDWLKGLKLNKNCLSLGREWVNRVFSTA